MKIKAIIAAAALILIGSVASHAQTNAPAPAPAPATTSPTPAQSVWAAKVADDARTLVFDFFSGITPSGVLSGIFALYLTAKGLRNKTSLGTGSGWIAVALNLINLERHQPAPAQPVAATNPPEKTT